MIKEISDYFEIEMTKLPSDDWDAIETQIKKTIKSSRAQADFSRDAKKGGDVEM